MNKIIVVIFLLLSVVIGMTASAGEIGEKAVAVEKKANYIVLRGGPGWANDSTRSPRSGGGAELKFKSEFDLNLAYGHCFFDWLRAEAELGWVQMEIDGMELKQRGQTIDVHGHDRHFRGMLNVYADWDNPTSFSPFVGMGLGVVRANLDLKWELPKTAETVRVDDWDWAFAWQFMAGVAWNINSSWEIELTYRYYATNDRSHENHSAATYPDVAVNGTEASFAQLGVRYCF